MEELAKILTVVAEYLDVDKLKILNGNTPQTATARDLICYVLEEGFPHLVSDFAVMAGMNVNAVYAASGRMSNCIKNDAEMCKKANVLRSKVGMRLLKNIEGTSDRVVSTTKQLFGFDYTFKEEIAYDRACREATAFMNDFCKGVQPVEEGFITVRRGKSR